MSTAIKKSGPEKTGGAELRVEISIGSLIPNNDCIDREQGEQIPNAKTDGRAAGRRLALWERDSQTGQPRTIKNTDQGGSKDCKSRYHGRDEVASLDSAELVTTIGYATNNSIKLGTTIGNRVQSEPLASVVHTPKSIGCAIYAPIIGQDMRVATIVPD